MDGRPTGAVRVSFGRQSTSEDVYALEQMIDCCFLGVQLPIDIGYHLSLSSYSAVVSRIVTYPVKSCRGIVLNKGVLTKTGLQYDRAFMIECCGTPVTQKRHQKLCKIITKLDYSDMTLSLTSADDMAASVRVPLHKVGGTARKNGIVCVNRVGTAECSASASAWVTSFLGLPDCKLQRLLEDSEPESSNEMLHTILR
ncbi:MOSC beta barrel domain protein [Ostertagia ostertagi]